jgi:hypothetical protein
MDERRSIKITLVDLVVTGVVTDGLTVDEVSSAV